MNALTPLPDADEAALPDHPADHGSAEKARAMVDRLYAADERSTAEMLQELRRAFPHSPLAVRIRALEALRRR